MDGHLPLDLLVSIVTDGLAAVYRFRVGKNSCIVKHLLYEVSLSRTIMADDCHIPDILGIDAHLNPPFELNKLIKKDVKGSDAGSKEKPILSS